MLASFSPSSGPFASLTYAFPYVKEQHIVAIQFGNTQAYPSRGVGHYNTAGTAPAFVKGGTIEATFLFTQNWLKINPTPVAYGATMGGLEMALNDFAQYIYAGGVGTLTDIPPSGTKTTVGGATVNYRTTRAYVQGTPQTTRRDGGSSAEVAVVFQSQSGIWTNDNGSWQYMI